jgi:hypothetical protein
MIGFSGTDPELRLLLETSREYLKYQAHPDYIFLSDGLSSIEERRLREDFGLEVIPYHPSDPSHSEVLEFVNFLASKAP